MVKSLKILFLAEGRLGDSIIITPALRAIKEKYPDSFITILMFRRHKYVNSAGQINFYIEKSDYKGTARVFLNNHCVDEVLEMDRIALRSLKGMKRIKSEFRGISYLRRQKYDIAVCTFPQNRFVIWAFLAGIKKRIGQKKQGFSFLLTDKPDLDRSESGIMNYVCNLLLPMGVTAASFETVFNISKDSVERIENIFTEKGIVSSKKIIAIHPGASAPDRQWPPEYLAELIKQLQSTKKYQIILCYSEYEKPFVNELKKYIETPLLEVLDDSIDDLAALLCKCDLALVNNSGPRHLAAAVKTKTLTFFEKYGDVMWKVYEDENFHQILKYEGICEVCDENKCSGLIPDGKVYGANCIRKVKVSDVFSRIESMFSQ